jgi:hypothetical protein
MPAPYRDPLPRFHSQWIEDEQGCRIWQGTRDKDGYGRFFANAKRYGTPDTTKAHRWIFEVMHGYAPDLVMHLCDRPACVNWERCLRPGTLASNHADMVAKGRHGHGVTGGARGIRHYKAKLTYDEVLEVRAAYAAGEANMRELAERYGMSRTGILRIVNMKTRVAA